MMPGTYANKTEVPVNKSFDEIKRTLQRFGATGFGFMEQGSQVAIMFEIKGLRVVMRMTLPSRDEFRRNSYGNERPAGAIDKDWEQACRQRWRTLANAIKAKLAMVDDGLSSVEQEFLANIWVPGAEQTYGEWAVPQIAEAYRSGELPPLLPGVTPPPSKVIELPERTAEGGRR